MASLLLADLPFWQSPLLFGIGAGLLSVFLIFRFMGRSDDRP